ncbi:hypothetical protein [Synoicihabitans lomoniglobus]|uniref:Uncharacterized protein n=1 Tax=Synoicihabitans lomoniglobus TaxID=2909285 RepID=A0AAE9ZSQ0_9BACT|nr:hypothetical protein [Opitutaceae bacterium LMO-M01]WED63462.1 hypothetical protein PXH66_14070 [Opitutaceae bacterium LMO-M01]
MTATDSICDQTRTASLVPPAEVVAALRDDLIELAFDLDQRAQYEAADVASTVAARLAELLPLNPAADA